MENQQFSNQLLDYLELKDGLIRFDENRNLSSDLKERDPNDLRIIQLIFQNPDESLNPNHTVEEIIAQPLKLYFGLKGEELKKYYDLLKSKTWRILYF